MLTDKLEHLEQHVYPASLGGELVLYSTVLYKHGMY